VTEEVAWCRFDATSHSLTLSVHVQPNSKASAIAGPHGGALKIRVAAPAVDDKANAALIDFLHRFLDAPASRISIRRGARNRRKLVEIAGATSTMREKLISAVTG
jgi:uncharacterized protein (TIGR00251 family)